MRKKKNVYEDLPEYEEETEYYEDEYEEYEDEWEEEKPRRTSKGRHVKPKAKPSRKKRIGRGVLIGILALVLVVVIAVVVIFNHFYGMMNIDKGQKDPAPGATPTPAMTETTPEPASPTPTAEPTATPEPLTEEELLMQELEMEAAELVYDENVYNILLVGSDSRNLEESARTDTMILVSINKATKELWITSLQRDIWIEIPNWGNAKLNAANVYGGVDLMIETIEQGFGIDIDNYAMLNFDGFVTLAEMAGGITATMTADEIYYMNRHIIEINHVYQAAGMDISSNDGIIWDLVDGTYHLNGKQTMGYCKMRDLDGTTARSARQRDAIMQMWNNVKQKSLIEIYKMVETAMGIVTTDMTQGQCASLMLLAPKLLDYEVNSHQIPVKGAYNSTKINGQSCYWLDYDVNRAYIKATIYGQDVDAKSLTSGVTGMPVQVYYPE